MPAIRQINSVRVRTSQDARIDRIDFQSINSPEGDGRFLAPGYPAGLNRRASTHAIVPKNRHPLARNRTPPLATSVSAIAGRSLNFVCFGIAKTSSEFAREYFDAESFNWADVQFKRSPSTRSPDRDSRGDTIPPRTGDFAHRPHLMSISSIQPNQIDSSYRSRTGMIRPTLPPVDDSDAPPTPPTPSRATSDRVRLEATPSAMLSDNRPEIIIHRAISNPPPPHLH